MDLWHVSQGCVVGTCVAGLPRPSRRYGRWRTRHDPRVIKRGAQEGRGRLMARLAGLRGREVSRRFAQGRPAVMTGGAASRDPGVIKRGPHKRGRGLVTTLAGRAGRLRGRRLTHDPRIPAAMTGRTPGGDPRVIHRGARPEGRRRFVARLARHCVVGKCVAGLPQPRPIPTVMAGGAAGRDPRVIKRGPHKRGRGLVTTLAGRVVVTWSPVCSRPPRTRRYDRSHSRSVIPM